MLVYKIVPRSLWTGAAASGSFAGAPVDLADGFIHFSTAAQVRDTARLHFGDRSDLLLVAVEGDRFGDALRWEESRGGALFPHLYGSLAIADAAWVVDLPLGPEGLHRFPADLS